MAVDPPTSLRLSFTDALTALIAGLPFIGSPIFAAMIDASAAAKVFVTGMQQTLRWIKVLYQTSGTNVSDSILKTPGVTHYS